MRLLARFKTLLAMTVAVAGIGSRLDAGIITTVPAGLNPGDKYRLVFVTSATWGAVSPDIGFYNAYVESLADATPGLQALGATWKAIGSTESVNAFDNIGASPATVGIYRLDGEKVANGTAALFGTQVVELLLAPIDITEGGVVSGDTWAWTGSGADGGALDNRQLGKDFPEAGFIHDREFWLNRDAIYAEAALTFYAISSEITVGGDAQTVPEPGSVGLTTLGGAILLFATRRKRKDSLAIQPDRTAPEHH
jgi:hypothetical protein